MRIDRQEELFRRFESRHPATFTLFKQRCLETPDRPDGSARSIDVHNGRPLLFEDLMREYSFPWGSSPEGFEFWDCIACESYTEEGTIMDPFGFSHTCERSQNTEGEHNDTA